MTDPPLLFPALECYRIFGVQSRPLSRILTLALVSKKSGERKTRRKNDRLASRLLNDGPSLFGDQCRLSLGNDLDRNGRSSSSRLVLTTPHPPGPHNITVYLTHLPVLLAPSYPSCFPHISNSLGLSCRPSIYLSLLPPPL